MFNRPDTFRRNGRPGLPAVPPDPAERARMIDEFIANNEVKKGATVFLLPSRQSNAPEPSQYVAEPEERPEPSERDLFLANAYKTEYGSVAVVAARHNVSRHRIYRALSLCGMDCKKPEHLIVQRLRREVLPHEAEAVQYFLTHYVTQVAVCQKFKIRRDRLRVLLRAEADNRGQAGSS